VLFRSRFIVGNSSYECSKFQASFLSPRVTSLLLNDATLSEYEIEGVGPCTDGFSFRDVLPLCHGGVISVTDSNYEFVTAVAKGLRNREMFETLIEFKFSHLEKNVANVLLRVLKGKFFDSCSSEDIEYLASHYYEIDESLLKSLDMEELRRIVSSPSLRVKDEDSFLGFMLHLFPSDSRFLGYVRSEYLSPEGIDRLLNAVSSDNIDRSIWASICRRLRFPVSVTSLPASRFAGCRFELDPSRPFTGIISHLSSISGGNIHTKGAVMISASSNFRNHCYQVADDGWNGFWYSDNLANSWIQFDFRERKISLTNYTIKSGGNIANHLFHWSIEGSNNGSSWITVDHRDIEDALGTRKVKSYACVSSESTSFYRFLRLIQTGLNSSRNNYLMLGNLEFFGTMTT
jgi:hypothetical protein